MSTEERNWINTFKNLFAYIVECKIFGRSRSSTEVSAVINDVSEMDMEIIQAVAQGGYGRVFRCRDLRTGDVVAMKQIPIQIDRQGVPASVIREVSVLKELHHRNIVSLLKVGHSNNDYVNLVFEHLYRDLHCYIRDRVHPIDAITRRSFMFQIVSAVAYCHSCKIVHRDLKPGNLLIDSSKKLIKLADFGLAREIGHPNILHTPNVGTSWYRAPEILFNFPEYSTPVDLWSVGCIFAEIVMGKPLFIALDSKDEIKAIFRLLGTPTEETWPGITKVMPNIRHSSTKYFPVGLETVVTELEPDGLNLLSMMLCLNPSQRISAEAALKHAYFKGVVLDNEGKSAEQDCGCT